MDTCTNGTIFNSDSGMESNLAGFYYHSNFQKNIYMWYMLRGFLKNSNVYHLFDFLIGCMSHILVNANFYHFFLTCLPGWWKTSMIGTDVHLFAPIVFHPSTWVGLSFLVSSSPDYFDGGSTGENISGITNKVTIFKWFNKCYIEPR